ncbi:acylphosphatase [Pseudoxanthobacter soli DSM 19599]|uniref:acylphosphatase n=2 Tax=Pseudoxanthobacter TaxID=433838 RepID=A0A1M7Z6V9_9HYPH|nr:acylphosphatase [Pseudoxanthobacter soli DSM 19599]
MTAAPVGAAVAGKHGNRGLMSTGTPSEDRKCVHVLVEGRVQGVGYRAWAERHARQRGLQGWVRNLSNGAVEALFCGPHEKVDDMLNACRIGPSASAVLSIKVEDAEPVAARFEILPTR